MLKKKVIGKIRDPYYPNQFNLHMLRVPEAWAYSKGTGVKVAVLDTGIDGSHQDLGWETPINITANDSEAVVERKYKPVLDAIYSNNHPKIHGGWNFIRGDNFTWDANRHGTYMAGTIAADIDNFGIVGVAPEAMLVPYVILDKDGRMPCEDACAKAIREACNAGCEVINMSLAYWANQGPSLNEVIYEVIEKGVIVVAAAGNSNKPYLPYPAGWSHVIAVGGCDASLRRWQHSKWRGSNYGKSLTCVCPATAQVTTQRMRSRFTRVDATSQACANMSGIIALMKSVKPSLKFAELLDLLESCSEQEWNIETGWGLPNAYRLVSTLVEKGKSGFSLRENW